MMMTGFLVFSNKTTQADTDRIMEYLSFNLSSKSLTLKKRDILPKPAANEVRIKVAYSGICGTDLHILEVCYHHIKNMSFLLS